MRTIDNESEKGPTIFKEEITVEEVSLQSSVKHSDDDLTTGENQADDSTRGTEFVPEITGVEYEEYVLKGSIEPHIDFKVEESVEKEINIDLNLPEDAKSEDRPKRQDIILAEEYQYQVPKDAYLGDRPYGVDMSIRTEDEVSELPDSEIASLVSDRKELGRRDSRDSDVSISDREYSDKDDENVVISEDESDEERPAEKPFGMAQPKIDATKPVIGESDFDLTLGTPSEISEFTLRTPVPPNEMVEKPKVESDYSKSSTSDTSEPSSSDRSNLSHSSDHNELADKPVEVDDSLDETESIGAIPERVYGDVYMQEISRLRNEPFISDTKQAQPLDTDILNRQEANEDDIDEKVHSISQGPERHIVVSENEESETGDSDEEEEKRKSYLLDEPGKADSFRNIGETFESPDNKKPSDKDYLFAQESRRPRYKGYIRSETPDSESDVPHETDESNFDVTTDLETTGDQEMIAELVADLEADLTPAAGAGQISDSSKTTDDESSTIKEEFITLVDSLERKPQQLIEVKDYVSSSEDESPKKTILIGQTEDRSESPVIVSGLSSAELELSRITEEAEESAEDSESESTASAESVKYVEVSAIRDEVLQQIPEESESVDVSMEMGKEDISDTSFDVDDSFNVEGPLARSTLGRDSLDHINQVIGIS